MDVARSRAAHPEDSDTDLQVPWTLKAGGARGEHLTAVHGVRTLVLNHLVHHRAQLGVYLRLTEQKVPPMYGPTADEK